MRNVPVFTLGLLCLMLGVASESLAATESASISTAPHEWVITQSASGNSYDTASEEVTIRGLTAPGLVAVSRVADQETIIRWEEGGVGPSIDFNRHTIVDGRSLEDVSRLTGFKANRAGDYVYLKTPKGPKARVQLYLNDEKVREWPRLSIVRILAFKDETLTVSVFDRDTRATQFWQFETAIAPPELRNVRQIGTVEDCPILKSRVSNDRLLLQLHCKAGNGSDAYSLMLADGTLEPLYEGQADALFAQGMVSRTVLKASLPQAGDSVPVLLVDGTASARSFFHAVTATFLKDLGEPMALASDGAGKQSWSQSYRTRALARLYAATGHEVFAALARTAMERTLRQCNQSLGVSGGANPPCAWASRIYSIDKTTPISLLINQAMISSSLLQSCSDLGDSCPPDLRRRIRQNATCLTEAYEKNFDESSQLYRITYGAPFRYDGLWAPWNWQMSWAGVLAHMADEIPSLGVRARGLVDRFTETWSGDAGGALWQYWPEPYYAGWNEEDALSVNRPRQSAKTLPRYEDLNHAGISLLGIATALGAEDGLTAQQFDAAKTRLDTLLSSGTVLPRDLDGTGPHSPRWMPGAGWDGLHSGLMRERYAGLMPGAHSSDQHLAYANLYDPAAPFELTLTLADCTAAGCLPSKTWHIASARAFLADNPLVVFKPAHMRGQQPM